MNTTTAKFDTLLTLEDALRRSIASAVYTDRPSVEKDAIAATARQNLNAAIAELTVDEIVAYGAYRQNRKA